VLRHALSLKPTLLEAKILACLTASSLHSVVAKCVRKVRLAEIAVFPEAKPAIRESAAPAMAKWWMQWTS